MEKSQNLIDRLHRSQSWMGAAKAQPSSEKHPQFICWYIAFNALYGIRQYEGSQEENRLDRQKFLKRLKILHSHDMRYGKSILLIGLKSCQSEAKKLITDYFPRDSYWTRRISSSELKQRFSSDLSRAEEMLYKDNYDFYLDLILRRLAVLRNQIFHGCATFGPTSKGLPSLEIGLSVLQTLVPAFYDLMDRYGHEVAWPPIPYPRVGSKAHPAIDKIT